MNKQYIKRTSPAQLIVKLMVNLIAIIISLSCIFPLIWLLYSSLKTKGEFLKNSLSFPEVFQWGNYSRAFELGNLFTSTLNSSFYVAVNIVLVSVSAIIAGYFIARFNFKGKKIIYFMYLLGFLIPIYGMLVPIFLQFKLLDMINTRTVLIFPYYAMQVPLAIFLIESFIRGIPRAIDEAAMMEGCNINQTLRHVIFPLSAPAVATIVILTSLQTWNEFGFSAVLISSLNLRTVSVAIQSFRAGMELELTFMMAALVSVSIPIIAVYLGFSKYIISGITTSGVKE